MSSGAKLHVYKCPSCGGAVKYDAATGSLSCRWCGSAYDSAELQAKEVDAELQGYLCPECGAELMADDFIAADTCPYCGNNEVAPHRFEGDFEPDFIIPFTVTKAQAIESYERAVAEKQFLPDDYIAEARVVSVQGTYVPFWLQDGVVDFEFTVGADDGARKNASYSSHHRAGTYAFSRVPADASERMPDDMMDSIEPYDYDALEPFSTEYLPGFVAERYTVGQSDVDARVDVRVKASAYHAVQDTIDSKWKHRYADSKRSCATVTHSESKQALLPVWLIVVAYRGEKYLVGVNGQTGKVAVNLPIDEEKQGKAVRKATVGDVLISISVMLFVPLVIFVIIIFDVGIDGLGPLISELLNRSNKGGNVDSETVFIIGGATLLYVAFMVFSAVFTYRNAKRKVIKSMQNVKVATDANAYDIGGLTLTISEMKKGPRQTENNWPE